MSHSHSCAPFVMGAFFMLVYVGMAAWYAFRCARQCVSFARDPFLLGVFTAGFVLWMGVAWLALMVAIKLLTLL